MNECPRTNPNSIVATSWTNANQVNRVMVLDNYYLVFAHNVGALWHHLNDYLAVLDIVHRFVNLAMIGLIDYCVVTMIHDLIDLFRND